MLMPRDDDPLPTGVLITTTGGLTGGDHVECRFQADAGARVRLTTQAAEKIYKARPGDGPVHIDVTLTAGPGAWLEWVPQETILFDHSALKRVTRLDVYSGGEVLAAEMSVLGRAAHGERWTRGLLHERWSVSVDGQLRWLDALRLDDDGPLHSPQAFQGARALATMVYVGPTPDDACRDALRQCLHDALQPQCAGGVTRVNGVIIGRLMGPDPQAVRRSLGDALSSARAMLADLPPELPRVWHT